MLIDATHENPHRLTSPGLGSPQTGLCGPFLFPFRWTFQRRGGRRSWRRRAHRTMEAHLVPLFIEAVPPPVKALRGLLFNLAEGVRIHHELDLGDAFFTVFPPFGSSETEAVVDFLPVERIQATCHAHRPPGRGYARGPGRAGLRHLPLNRARGRLTHAQTLNLSEGQPTRAAALAMPARARRRK